MAPSADRNRTRRTVLGASVAGAAGLLASAQTVTRRTRRKAKKRCKNGAKRCGKKGCCKGPSICSAASCFCTGSEGNCKSISQELIDIISQGSGFPADQIGENPDLPLEECNSIPEITKIDVDIIIEKEFGVIGPVPWCQGGVTAGVEALLDKLKEKA